ncbi:MAG: hypothetical protein ACR2P1_11020 [Pseudomonadales bacterium]
MSREEIAYYFGAISAIDGRGVGSGTMHMDVHVSRRPDAVSDQSLELKKVDDLIVAD